MQAYTDYCSAQARRCRFLGDTAYAKGDPAEAERQYANAKRWDALAQQVEDAA